MQARTRKIAKDVLPPIVARRIQSLRKPAPNAGGASQSTPLAPGTEADADWYDESFESARGEHYQRPYWELNWYAALSVVADRIMQRDDPRVLDMGCGPAPLAGILRHAGLKHYTGFDFSRARLDFAQARYPEYEFILADAYTTDLFETVDYNVVVGTEFLEHLDRDVFVLDRVRPGALVLCNVPDYGSASHVRHFKSEEEVEARYGEYLDNFRCVRIRNVSGSSEYLFSGTKRASTA
jgi:SAM-dependent methyltransferase